MDIQTLQKIARELDITNLDEKEELLIEQIYQAIDQFKEHVGAVESERNSYIKALEEIAVVMSMNDDAVPLDLASQIKGQWLRVIEDVSWAKAYVNYYWETRNMARIMDGVWNILEDYLDEKEVELAWLQIADIAEQEARGSIIPVVGQEDEADIDPTLLDTEDDSNN